MITILGSGLSGLSAAYHLREKYVLLEKEVEAGGLCRSVTHGEYIFDIAPHILFTRDVYAENLFRRLLEGNLLTHIREAYIFLENTYVKYPFEANLHPLPKHVIEECIKGVIERPLFEPHNFREWIMTTFGEGIAKYYMVPYNEKIWKYDLSKMNIEWVAGRVPAPSVNEMEKGAIGELEKDFGPNAQFWYPEYDGIAALPNSLAQLVEVEPASEVVEVRPSSDRVETIYRCNGALTKNVSDYVFSSVPLPELVKMIGDAPTDVVKASKSLVYNSLICIDVGVSRAHISDKHWLYFPERDVIFNRISFPMNLSPNTTPKNKSSVLVEVTYRGERPDMEQTKTKVIEDLVKTGILKDDDDLDLVEISDFKYAYVIYDLDHRRNVDVIHRYLEDNRIIPIGRFGEWEYYNMDKAMLSGKRAADRYNEGLL
jgi:protoporphyrinogen oxidase